MKKIVFIHRNKTAGVSIEKVATPILDKIKNKAVVSAPEIGANPIKLLKNLLFILKNRQNNAIHHITGDIHYGILALIGKTSVLTVHDTVSLDFNNGSKLKKFFIKLFWFKLPIKFATKVVCISEETKKSLQKYTNRQDIIVIHNSVDSKIKYIKKDFCKENPNILIIGTNKNKNIENQLKALQGLQCNLTIVGNLSPEQKELLELYKINYQNKSNLSDSEIYEEYYKTDLVLFCSLFEGFGMPILEANKSGTPVITSDIPVLKEVANDAALFVDPNNPDEIRKGIEKLIFEDNIRTNLILKGIQNADNHTIDKIFPYWEKLYNSLS